MINKLIANIKKTNAPIVVGLDPMLNYVPEHVQKKAFAEYGETLEGAAEAVWQFNKAIVDATYDLIPAVKPQVAMYEQFGVPGMAAYEKTVSYCQEKGLVVIGDIKRGDIGSTSEAYADSNLQTKAVEGPEDYPMREFLDNGLLVTVNTDNRTVSNTSISRELGFIQETYGIRDDELKLMMENAVRVSFAGDSVKDRILKEIRAFG